MENSLYEFLMLQHYIIIFLKCFTSIKSSIDRASAQILSVEVICVLHYRPFTLQCCSMDISTPYNNTVRCLSHVDNCH